MCKNFLYITFISSLLMFSASCSSDTVSEITTDEQNSQDDTAISQILDNYYFQPDTGKITAFSSSLTFDDNFDKLSKNATKLPSGVVIVRNPSVTATGHAIKSDYSKKLLMSYAYLPFSSTKTDGTVGYSLLSAISVSTLATGTAKWDNDFYYHQLTSTDTSKGYSESYYEIEGLQEGLSYFKTTERNIVDAPVFQGIIIVPSRLVYARDSNYLGGTGNSTYNYMRNVSLIFNFEILKEEP